MFRILTKQLIYITSIVVVVFFNVASVHATPDADSWQKQTLLATTKDQYLVLEISGFTPGYPPEYTEVVRYVFYDANTNAQVKEILISKTKSTFGNDAATPEKLSPDLDKPLSDILANFGGRLPRTAKNLTKRFTSDESGLYIVSGDNAVLIFTAEELTTRKSGTSNTYDFILPKVISLQFSSKKYYLTLRSLNGNGGDEIVFAMNR